MEFNHEEYSDSKPVPTVRDQDDNLLSVTSSNVSYNDESQFVEVDNTNFIYNVNSDIIDFEFKEFVVAEKTIEDKIEDLFNLYEEVKESVNITGNENSHLYLFNSSVQYIGRENLIAVDRDEYSNMASRNQALLNQLRICNETKEAENLARDKKLTALYTTVNSIKNGAVNVIDNTLLPVIGDNLQLRYAINSLKSIISQPIGYLVDNKNELTVEKRNIKTQRYEITYNYLTNPNYFNDIFQDLLNNPDLSRYQSRIATLEARISQLEDLLADASSGGDTGGDTGGGDTGGGDTGGGDTGGGDTGGGDTGGGDTGGTTNDVVTVYNRMYDMLISLADFNIQSTGVMSTITEPPTKVINDFRNANLTVNEDLIKYPESFSGTEYNSRYRDVRNTSIEFIDSMIRAIDEYTLQPNLVKKAYAKAMKSANDQWKTFLQNNGKIL